MAYTGVCYQRTNNPKEQNAPMAKTFKTTIAGQTLQNAFQSAMQYITVDTAWRMVIDPQLRPPIRCLTTPQSKYMQMHSQTNSAYSELVN